MTAIIRSGKPVLPGALQGIDMTGYRINPELLYATHRARVIADGGFIPDEADTLEEFKFIANNGFYSRVSAWPSVNAGLKVDQDNHVLKVYSLVGPDFIPVTVEGSVNPPAKITIDTSGSRRAIRVVLNNGGTYLRSETAVAVQSVTNAPWLLSARMRDLNIADNAGLTLGWGVANATYAFMETRRTPTISNPWKYVATNIIPVASGSYVAATHSPYADFANSAGLFDPMNGVVSGYQDGSITQQGTSSNGHLADFAGLTNFLWIGTTYLSEAAQTNRADGTFAIARCLNLATVEDAMRISARA
ncbi:hypothetical protein [Serratia quinivorans]|uniref:hypothetical protein n=1 Tax=Serratia quinivorans TaxID=137545 RepID=UPI00398264FA